MASVQELKKDFQRLADAGRLAHGYIFFGATEQAQVTFAFNLAGYLESKDWNNSGAVLLDTRLIDTRLESGIDVARSISGFLWQKPVAAPKRTLIIGTADALTPYAQNAILKITEEPPEHALIILCLKDPSSLINPLASRFQKFYFSGIDEAKAGAVRDGSDVARNFFNQFLSAATNREKSEAFKDLMESEDEKPVLAEFMKLAIMELHKDLPANWLMIKNLLQRWTYINQFNVNKKLQLEAALLSH